MTKRCCETWHAATTEEVKVAAFHKPLTELSSVQVNYSLIMSDLSCRARELPASKSGLTAVEGSETRDAA
ncbi:hypothetical protein E5288_WYG022415 [Bos mutus]|uniref:Uncharacterized protein n=1 Tax=Bos mutus TaxID=72004 RepID=A0A6B0RWF4_9CETA|nr:hypothetical protein [Bos mutus]